MGRWVLVQLSVQMQGMRVFTCMPEEGRGRSLFLMQGYLFAKEHHPTSLRPGTPL